MRRIGLFVALVLCLVLATAVFAAYPATEDASIVESAPGTNFGDSTQVGAASEGSVGTPTDCSVPTTVGYLKFDLSGVNGTISNDTNDSTLDMVVTSSTLVAGGGLQFYGIADDSWNEVDPSGITWNTAPYNTDFTAATDLGSMTVGVVAVGETVSFTSANLINFLNEESAYAGDGTVGDNTASIAFVVIGCGNTGSIFFQSSEGATAPTLNLYNPTAVQMQTISANQGGLGISTATMMVIGLALFTAGLIAIVSLRRKKPSV